MYINYIEKCRYCGGNLSFISNLSLETSIYECAPCASRFIIEKPEVTLSKFTAQAEELAESKKFAELDELIESMKEKYGIPVNPDIYYQNTHREILLAYNKILALRA